MKRRYPKLPDTFVKWFKSHGYTRERNFWMHPNLVTVGCSYSHETSKWYFTVNGHTGFGVPSACSAEHPETAIREAYALRIAARPAHATFFESELAQLEVVPLNVSRQQLYAWMHTDDEARIQHGIDTINDVVERAFLCDHLRQVQLKKRETL